MVVVVAAVGPGTIHILCRLALNDLHTSSNQPRANSLLINKPITDKGSVLIIPLTSPAPPAQIKPSTRALLIAGERETADDNSLPPSHKERSGRQCILKLL